MYSILLFTYCFFGIWCSCHAKYLSQVAQFYEYGEHVEGEQISFMYNGVLPGFKPNFNLNVTSHKEELKPGFSYLRVEYFNMLSDVNVSYDPVSYKLNFHVKFPFVDTIIGVLGYSVPIGTQEQTHTENY